MRGKRIRVSQGHKVIRGTPGPYPTSQGVRLGAIFGKGDVGEMSGSDSRGKRVGRDSVVTSVKGVLRTHAVNPDNLDDTVVVLCRGRSAE